MSEPNPVGRPSSYAPEYCEQVIELAHEGAGKAEIASVLGVNRKTLDYWAEKYPEFSDAISHARDRSAGWWEKQGRLGVWSRDFNANAYRLQVMNRFPEDWRDKQEFVGKDGSALIPEDPSTRDLAKAVLALLGKGVKPD